MHESLVKVRSNNSLLYKQILQYCTNLTDVVELFFFLAAFGVVDELFLFFLTGGVRPRLGKTILGADTGTMLVSLDAGITCFFFLFGGPL